MNQQKHTPNRALEDDVWFRITSKAVVLIITASLAFWLALQWFFEID